MALGHGTAPASLPSAAGPRVSILHSRGPVVAPGQLERPLEEPVRVRGVQARGESELKMGALRQ